MTVLELIQQLQTLPPEAKVVVRGYEEGYNDILQLKQVSVMPKVNAFWWDGEYEESSDTNAIDAIELYGENQNPVDDLK
jgi:hypothetical protein